MLFHKLISVRRTGQQVQHGKSVKIGASLFTLNFVCFSPAFINAFTNKPIPGYLHPVVFINNFANVFVYFWIDVKFRNFVLCRPMNSEMSPATKRKCVNTVSDRNITLIV